MKKNTEINIAESKTEVTSSLYNKNDYWAKIILAEDNIVNQKIVESQLKKVNLKIDIASSGEEVLNFLKKEKYDLVFMDLQMPIMDGFTATKKIRESNFNKDIPIIALTAFSDQPERKRCIECGMDDFISKPLEPKELYEILDKWIINKDKKSNLTDENLFEPITEKKMSIEQEYKDEDLINTTINTRFRGNTEFYLKMVALFYETLDEHLNNLRESISNNDPEKLKYSAHAIKGSSANIGIEKVRAIAGQLENKCYSLTVEQANRLYDLLMKELEIFKVFSKTI